MDDRKQDLEVIDLGAATIETQGNLGPQVEIGAFENNTGLSD